MIYISYPLIYCLIHNWLFEEKKWKEKWQKMYEIYINHQGKSHVDMLWHEYIQDSCQEGYMGEKFKQLCLIQTCKE